MGKCPFCDKQHRRLIPRPFQPPGGKAKDDRIFAYLDPILQDKRLYLRKGMNKLREQIITHPHSQLKDELDALASGCSLLRPPTSADQLKEEAAMDEFMQQRTSRTFLANEVGGYV
jgi:3-methyladenine DNA glycosylase AlkC